MNPAEMFVTALSPMFDEIALVRLLFDAFNDPAAPLLAEGKRLLAEGYSWEAVARFKEASDLGDAEATGLAAFWLFMIRGWPQSVHFAKRGVMLEDMTSFAVLAFHLNGDDPEISRLLSHDAAAAPDNPYVQYMLYCCVSEDDMIGGLEALKRAVDLDFPPAFSALLLSEMPRSRFEKHPYAVRMFADPVYSRVALAERGAALGQTACAGLLVSMCRAGEYVPRGAETLATLEERHDELERRNEEGFTHPLLY